MAATHRADKRSAVDTAYLPIDPTLEPIAAPRRTLVSSDVATHAPSALFQIVRYERFIHQHPAESTCGRWRLASRTNNRGHMLGRVAARTEFLMFEAYGAFASEILNNFQHGITNRHETASHGEHHSSTGLIAGELHLGNWHEVAISIHDSKTSFINKH
jgi:hypothetical protein